MKILFVNTWMHPKNMHSLLSYKSVELTTVNLVTDIDSFDLTIFDFVYSPSDPIDVTKYPNVCFVFGPHFSTFPNEKVFNIQSDKTLYLMPSQWCIDDWIKNPLCKNLNMVACPFGVDTDKFCEIVPIRNRNMVFIYYKSRHPKELEIIETILNNNNITYKVFNYHKRYNENEYLEYLQHAKFGIWVDGHESQGFALEEALSCNVPLLVWNVSSMSQEYGKNNPHVPATSIPYWDERCGEYFYDMTDIREKIALFFKNLNSYRPRDYVLENLSIPVCEQRFLQLHKK
jgi:glycosyltransferase involved in cell wall biosynthesis